MRPSSERNIYGPKRGTSLNALASNWENPKKFTFSWKK